jgi:hypothetical protein
VFAEQPVSIRPAFFVENRTGGGLIGTAGRPRAPDGYTLITSGMPSHVLAPAMNKNASFDPVEDFTHIAIWRAERLRRASDGGREQLPGIAGADEAPTGCNTFRPASARSATWWRSMWPTRKGGSFTRLSQRRLGDPGSGRGPCQAKHDALDHAAACPRRQAQADRDLVTRVAEFPDVPTLVELGYPELIVRTWYSLSGPQPAS